MALDWNTQKKIMFFFGVLVIIAGALPLIVQYYNAIALPSFIPLSGWKYQLIILVLGVLLVFFGKPSKNSY